MRIILDKNDFETFMYIQDTIIGIRNTIVELITYKTNLRKYKKENIKSLTDIEDTIVDLTLYRGLWEKNFHKFWIKIRKKHKLNICKNYIISRIDGEITENDSNIPMIIHKRDIVINENLKNKEDLFDV